MLPKKKSAGGAPEWALTYGDMMSLLLTFFILLAAFADFEKGGASERMMAAIHSIQEALGMPGQRGKLADRSLDFNAMLQRLETIIATNKSKQRGDTDEEGLHGEEFRLRRIRDGMEITIGGPVLFEPFSDQLTEDGRRAMEEIGGVVAGHRNKIEVRGHAADEPRPADWTHQDAWRLSYARAERVAVELVRRGVDQRTVRIVAAGASEPVVPQAYKPTQRGDNRRVEIIIRESLIDDYSGQTPVPATAPVGGPAAGTRPAVAPRQDRTPASRPASATST